MVIGRNTGKCVTIQTHIIVIGDFKDTCIQYKDGGKTRVITKKQKSMKPEDAKGLESRIQISYRYFLRRAYIQLSDKNIYLADKYSDGSYDIVSSYPTIPIKDEKIYFVKEGYKIHWPISIGK